MKKSLEKIFQENLRFYRQQKKLSQEKLSTLLDKNINYINIIESGKSFPPLAMIEKISDTLSIEPYLLFMNIDKNNIFNKVSFIEEASSLIAEQSKEVLHRLLNKNF